MAFYFNHYYIVTNKLLRNITIFQISVKVELRL